MVKVDATPKHPGGRPPKDPSDKVIKCHVSLTGAHHAATEGDRAGMIRRALDFEAKYKKIIDAVILSAHSKGLSFAKADGLHSIEWEISLRTSNGELISMLNDWANGERKK